MMNAAYALGRIFVPVIFVWEALHKLFDIDRFAKLLSVSNVPIPEIVTPYLGGMPKYLALAWALAVIELVCGVLILIGLKARWAALVMIVFTASTIFFVHNFWDMSGDAYEQNQIHALKNLSILGALLLIASAGSGPYSVDNRNPDLDD
jgi:putative oxidoreductase